jgi:hypothetical protein
MYIVYSARVQVIRQVPYTLVNKLYNTYLYLPYIPSSRQQGPYLLETVQRLLLFTVIVNIRPDSAY